VHAIIILGSTRKKSPRLYLGTRSAGRRGALVLERWEGLLLVSRRTLAGTLSRNFRLVTISGCSTISNTNGHNGCVLQGASAPFSAKRNSAGAGRACPKRQDPRRHIADDHMPMHSV
jgi:hypothetical protein